MSKLWIGDKMYSVDEEVTDYIEKTQNLLMALIKAWDESNQADNDHWDSKKLAELMEQAKDIIVGTP